MLEKQKQKQIEEIIFNRYDTLILNRKQVSKIINKSKSTLDRWRKERVYLEFRKLGKSKNAQIEYTIYSVAKYIIQNELKII